MHQSHFGGSCCCSAVDLTIKKLKMNPYRDLGVSSSVSQDLKPGNRSITELEDGSTESQKKCPHPDRINSSSPELTLPLPLLPCGTQAAESSCITQKDKEILLHPDSVNSTLSELTLPQPHLNPGTQAPCLHPITPKDNGSLPYPDRKNFSLTELSLALPQSHSGIPFE